MVAGGATITRDAGPSDRVRRRLVSSPNAWPVACLVVLPVLVFAPAAMTGHPAVSYDNLLQNFPLRVFTGSLIRQGHLPLWNPTIWSGSPLLAGLNAGAFYPGTMLFVVLPGILAWVLNLIGLYWAAGIGMYALTRQFALRPMACLLAALTYQFGGAMTGQLVHLGVVQGMSWMPLVVLAEIRLSWAVLGTGPSPEYRAAPTGPASPWPWVTLLAAASGLVFLTGEPRGMAELEIVASVVLVWLVARSYPGQLVDLRRRALCLGYGALAAAWGVAIGASQLLPGRTFISASQRSAENYAFFGLGSLRPAWTIMLLVQNVVGGNGAFGQPVFSATYNLPEVTGYVGLVPLSAFFVLLVRSLGRGSDPRARDWRPWLFLGALGLLLSWGTYTPLGHVFAQIPFYNKVRLDSRNLGIVDLGLSILFAFWVELYLAGEWHERTLRPGRWWREVAVPMFPPAAGLLAALAALVVPGTVVTALGGSGFGLSALRPWMAAQAAVAVGALAVVWAWGHWRPTGARRLLVVVVVADLGLFALTSSTGMFDGGLTQPTRAQAARVVGTVGRFAIVGSPSIAILSEVSEPDLNALTGLDSVQGYGSILSGAYDQTTGTHLRSTMDPCALARGVFVPLRLTTVLLVPSSFSEPLAPGASPGPPTPCPGAPRPGTVTSRTFYLGDELAVSAVDLHGGSAGGPPRVGVVGPTGAPAFPPASVRRVAGGWVARFARPAEAAGIVVVGRARSVQDTSVVTTASGDRYALDGPFQDAMGQTWWHPAGFWEGYQRFRTSRIGPVVSVEGAPGATAGRLSTTPWGTETDLVDTPGPATVVRSEAYLAGWRVTAEPLDGGASRTLPVVAVGLLQGVHVPPGRWRLTFSYWPSGLTVGGIGSAVGVAGVLAVTGARLLGRRRRPRAAAGGGR